MKKLYLLIIPILFLSSCLSVDTRITLNNDGSGEVMLQYEISQIALNIGMYDKNSSDLPLPVGLNDFQRTVNTIDGLELVPGTWSFSEDEDAIQISASMTFESLDALNRFYSPGAKMITLSEAGENSIYTQVIHTAPEVETDEDSIEFADIFFSDYALSFVVTLPEDIKNVNIGDVSGKTASYSISIPELVRAGEEIKLEITF